MDQSLILFNVLLWQDYCIVQFSLCLCKKKINTLYTLQYIVNILEFCSRTLFHSQRQEG